MDQPNSRRRRHVSGANSVTVAELQAKSTPAEREIVSAIQARMAAEAQAMTTPLPVLAAEPAATTLNLPAAAVDDPAEDSDEPGRGEEPIDEPRTSTRLARTIVAMLVAVVACGVVTGVAALGGERPHRLTPTAPVVRPGALPGPAAVRLDQIVSELTKGTAGDPLPPPPTTTGQPAPLATHNAASKVVSDFYASVVARNNDAYDLLAPVMQGGDRLTFQASWRGNRTVTPTILPSVATDNGSVRVRVSIEHLDGSIYELVVRMWVRPVLVDEKHELRITNAQLLSAHMG